MSALTKVSVLLLVVLSLVETAGIVVYVNRGENFSKALSASRNDVATAKADAAAARDQSNMADLARQQVQADAQNQRNSAQQTIDGLRAANLEKDTALAAANANLLQVTAGQKSANDALLVAQKTNDTLNGQLADIRKQNLDLQKRDSENSLALIDVNNKYDVVNREWRQELENNTQLQNSVKSLSEAMHRAGVSLNDSPTLNAEPLIRVEGVVSKKENVNGVNMATISIGSADQVTKGMRLAVIDPTAANPFLGYLFVERVEPNSAIGRLEGPHVDQVRQGVQVRTQL